MDCGGNSIRWTCAGASGLALEYLAIEFARDVEYVTAAYPTTQESVITGYLKPMDPSPEAIVFNTGLHDTNVHAEGGPHERLRIYKSNIEWYAGLIADATAHAMTTQVIWLTTTAVNAEKQPRGWRNITFNELIRRQNEEASVVMRHFVEVDQFAISMLPAFQRTNEDGVHYSTRFYEMTAWELLKHICRRHLLLSS
jgi:hypothetical protein